MTTPHASPETADRIRRIESGLLVESTIPNQAYTTASLAERMAHHKTPGVSVAVIRDFQVEWARGYGVREAGRPEPVTPETLFQAGSISKPVAAVAALRLVEQGRLDLDEDVNRYLVSWKVPANDGWQPRVTLRQLLSHTGGTTVHGFPGYAQGQEVPALVQVLDGGGPANTAAIRVNAVPGTQARYSGGGTTIVQQMLIDVLGKPFPQLMRELVLDPVGMAHSTYEQPLPEARWAGAATAHPTNGKPLEGRWHTYPEMAAAGLWTTAGDLARFAAEIQLARAGKSDRLLSAAMANKMLSPRVDEQTGLGLFLEGTGTSVRFGHGGWDEGFVARLTASRDQGFGAVVMLNSNQGWPMQDEILRAVAKEYDWPGFLRAERETAAVSPEVLQSCIGEYELRPEFTLTVARRSDTLSLQPTGQDPIPIYPASETRFFAKVVDTEVTFVRGDDGAVTELIFRQNGRDLPAKRRDRSP